MGDCHSARTRTVGETLSEVAGLDVLETRNLAYQPDSADVLATYQAKLKQMQKELGDPWIMKWDYE